MATGTGTGTAASAAASVGAAGASPTPISREGSTRRCTRERSPPLGPKESVNGGMSNGARMAAEDAEKEDNCPICCEILPDTGRGVLPCGHVFCFSCVHLWWTTTKKKVCPTCRVEFNTVIKTLTDEDVAKEKALWTTAKKKKVVNRQTQKRSRKKASRIKTTAEGVKTKTFHVKDTSKSKKKSAANRPQWLIDYRRRQEERQRIEVEQAQARAHELAAEAQHITDENAERFRTLRERWNLAVEEQARRSGKVAEEADAPDPLEAAASAWEDTVDPLGQIAEFALMPGSEEEAASSWVGSFSDVEEEGWEYDALANALGASGPLALVPPFYAPASPFYAPASPLYPPASPVSADPRSRTPETALQASLRRPAEAAAPVEGGRHDEPSAEQGHGQGEGGGEDGGAQAVEPGQVEKGQQEQWGRRTELSREQRQEEEGLSTMGRQDAPLMSEVEAEQLAGQRQRQREADRSGRSSQAADDERDRQRELLRPVPTGGNDGYEGDEEEDEEDGWGWGGEGETGGTRGTGEGPTPEDFSAAWAHKRLPKR
eukprot:g10631.t1